MMVELEKAGIPTKESTNRTPVKLHGLYRIADSSYWYWNARKKCYGFMPQFRYTIEVTRQVRTAPWKTQERTGTAGFGYFNLPQDLNRVRNSLPQEAESHLETFDAYRLLQDHPEIVHDMMKRTILSQVIWKWKFDNAPPTPVPAIIGSKLRER